MCCASPGVPPQVCAGLTSTLGFAVLWRSAFVAATSRFSDGYADQRGATTPKPSGRAMDVPHQPPGQPGSPVFPEERIWAPGAEMLGFSRCEPSTATSPRL